VKNPVYEQIQARKVKARLGILQHAQRVSGNVGQTCLPGALLAVEEAL
jgi:hypothetical protein